MKASNNPSGYSALHLIKQNILIYLLISIFVFMVFCIRACDENLERATAHLTYTYLEANRGLNPNGTRFSIDEIKSDDILGAVLEKTGLSDSMSTRDLAEMISISALNTSSNAVSVKYSITYMNDDVIENIPPESMLSVILAVYKQYFENQYVLDLSSLKPDLGDTKDMEYLDISALALAKLDAINHFAKARYERYGTYSSPKTGNSYVSISKRCDDFKSMQLERFNSYIQQTKIYRNSTAYSERLSYEIFLKNQKYQYTLSQYNTRVKAMDIYDESIAAIVMVPTFKEGSGYYMSRTDIGIDTLTKQAESFSSTAQKQALVIDTRKVLMDSVSSFKPASNRTANMEKAEQMLNGMQRELTLIYDDLAALEDEFQKDNQPELFIIHRRSLSIMQGWGVKDAFIYGAGVFFALCLFTWLASRRRKEVSMT